MKLFIVLFFLCTIFFIPIPIKFKAYYGNDDYYVKLYNLNLFSKQGGIIKKFINKKKSKKSNTNSTKKKNSAKKKSDSNEKDNNSNKKKKVISYSRLYSKLTNNKFKPKLKFYLNSKYDLSDAANTAIVYGLSNNINFILYNILSIVFKIKNFKFNLMPLFNSNLYFNITIDGIFTFNIAQIIYILFLIRKNIEEVPL